MLIYPNTRQRASRCSVCVLAVFVIFYGVFDVRADSDAIPNRQAETTGLFAPTLGRPVFVEPGETFQVVACIPNVGAAVNFDLVSSEQRQLRYHLQCESDAVGKLAAGQPLRLTVPRTVPPRTYDLLLSSNGTRLLGQHCVAVGHVGRSLRLIHLSNMNVGDAGAPQFDQRLIEEVNLLAPTLIVATGDFLDATHPDPSTGWRQLVDYLTRFDAPIVMACGDHDDMELYSRHVAPSPIGMVNVGRHRGLLLFDNPRAPINNNPEQIRWVERALGTPGFDGLTFVVTHDDSPNLPRYWQQQGTLARMIQAGRIGLWFAAGHRDWDGRTYREIIDEAAPMVYLQTHQSSTAPRGGATGISHYRIVDIVDDRVILPRDTSQTSGTPPSTPVGYLSATLDGPNDGTRSQLNISAVNNLPYRLNGLALSVRLRKNAGDSPWCHGARLAHVSDLGTYWECRLRFDLPDKASLRAAVGSGQRPAVPHVQVHFETGGTLRFRRYVTPDGLAFLSLTHAPPIVHLRNAADKLVVVSPLARLDGDPIAYRPLDGNTHFATAYRLRLKPGETVCLQLDLSAVRVAPGQRELQIYLEGTAVAAPFCQAVHVVVDGR